jgi:predicted ATPase
MENMENTRFVVISGRSSGGKLTLSAALGRGRCGSRSYAETAELT